MATLMDFIDGATNNFKRIATGQEPIEYDAYAATKRFAQNYQSQSPYSYSNAVPQATELFRNDTNFNPYAKFQKMHWKTKKKLLAESATTTVQEYVSKEITEEKFKPIYGKEFKKLLWDMYLNDYIAGEAVNIKSWAGFQNQSEISLLPIGNKVYESQQDLDAELDTIMSEQERKKLVEYIEQTNRLTRFREYQQFLSSQAMVGGVAAMFIETWRANPYDIPIGTPAIIKPLHWSYLDQVRVNTDDWKLKSVRYTDFETNFSQDGPVFIPANQMIYVTRNDKMITPNNLYYGISDYHSILKLSNIIRQAEEIDLPEIVTSMWAQGGIFKFKNMNIPEMDRFMANIGPGLVRGFNSQIDFMPYNIKHDGWFLITLMQMVIEHMLMKLRIPAWLYSFGGKNASRSDVEIQMNAFRDVVLDQERWWMGCNLDYQWYNYLIMLHEKITDPIKLKVRVVQNYIPLNFEDILAKANSLELLVRRYFIDIHEGRQYLGLKPYNKNIDDKVNAIGQLLDIPPMDKLKFEQQQKANEENFKRQQDAQQTKMDQFGGPQKPEGQTGFKPPAERVNSKNVSVPGAGRGNKT